MKRFGKFLGIPLLVIAAFGLLGASYNTSAPAPVILSVGSCQTLISSTDGTPPASAFKSQEFQILDRDQNSPPSSVRQVRFELIWSGNPGAFNIQIQDADTDLDGNFVTVPNAGTITSTPQTVGLSYVSRVELQPWAANFGRLYVNTQAANAVTLTARACR